MHTDEIESNEEKKPLIKISHGEGGLIDYFGRFFMFVLASGIVIFLCWLYYLVIKVGGPRWTDEEVSIYSNIFLLTVEWLLSSLILLFSVGGLSMVFPRNKFILYIIHSREKKFRFLPIVLILGVWGLFAMALVSSMLE